MKKSVWQEKYKKLSTELRAIRTAAGYTQVQLAEKLGKPQSYVSKYESGDRYLDFIEVLDVCEICGTSPVELMNSLGTLNKI